MESRVGSSAQPGRKLLIKTCRIPSFGQSSSSPFGSSGFGQTAAPANNPFAPKPFGSPSPFGSQTGNSIFGGTSTGMFGAPQASSPFPSTTTFGASSSPAFGSSMPAFGASSTPAFSSSPSSFGGLTVITIDFFVGSSAFGQKPAFGGFGSSTPTPFGSTTQQSQPAFGSSLFGSSAPFGAASQSGFGATSTPAFGSTSTPAFGSTSTPAFGAASTPSFGATSTPAFGSTASPAFGSTGSAFGVSNTPAFGTGAAFGASNTSVFGSSSTPAFGAASSPAFGAASSPAFGSSNTQIFGGSSSPSFSFASTSAFGQSTSAFGSSPFGAQSSAFGAQATTPTFGSSGFGQTQFGAQKGGSRAVPYATTADTESTGAGGQPGKLESISAMPAYKEKSHEELRWEDYQLGDKGGPLPSGQPSGGISFSAPAAQSNPFGSSSTFAQPAANPFSSSTSTNPFAPKAFGPTPTSTFNSSPFGTSTTANPFQSTSFASTSAGGFGTTSPSLFGTSSSSSFGSTPSLFTSTAQGTTSAFGQTGFASSSSPLFQSTTPSLGQTGSVFGQTASSFGPSSASPFGQSNMFNTPATSQTGGLFSNTPSLFPSTNTGGFGQTTLAMPQKVDAKVSLFAGGTSGFAGASGQNNYGQQPMAQNSIGVLQVPVTNPFGTLPAMPQISIARAGTTPSVQYGISSLPVVDKPAPVRVSSLLTSRHLLQRRMKMPSRKYYPKHDGPKVPFFSDEEESPSTPKADALFVPRENPRALVIRPVDQSPMRTNAEKASPIKDVNQNGKALEAMNGEDVSSLNGSRPNGKAKNPAENGNGNKEHVKLSGHRAGEAAIVYEHGADIEALMPKLRRADYYTEPRIQELAAKERAEPGYCRRVKDFVVGRRGFGSIKFLDETDVRRLDLDSLVHFNTREVIVYMDDHQQKPPVGQGLNKPAEVTLLNIKCVDRRTKKEFTEGKRVEKYKETLKKKTEEQGAEFVSYDAVKGEWKFKVKHFSSYKLIEEEEEDGGL
ncbi:Nuclear pore complex protein NUP98A [Linum perenne]